MILEKKKSNEYERNIEIIANYLRHKGYDHIRAQALDDYQEPAELKKMGEDEGYKPDLTARRDASKYYFEIVDYSQKDKDAVVTKWMLLSALAKQRTGELFLMVPHGKLNFTNRIVKDYGIAAQILPIKNI